LSDLTTSERKDIIVNDEYLQSLVSREVMTDDYLTHDKLCAEFSHTYNARLNLSGVKRELFGGFTAASMFSYLNSDTPSWQGPTKDNPSRVLSVSFPTFGYSVVETTVYIKEDGNVYGVSAASHNNYTGYFLSEERYPSDEDASNGTNGFLEKRSWGCYAFYPNINAFKMIIRDWKGAYEIKLMPHQFLNGAYAVLDYELERAPQTPTYPSTSHPATIEMPNKIYTSEVNNPFYFPILGINSVGTGKFSAYHRLQRLFLKVSSGNSLFMPLLQTAYGLWKYHLPEPIPPNSPLHVMLSLIPTVLRRLTLPSCLPQTGGLCTSVVQPRNAYPTASMQKICSALQTCLKPMH